MMIVLPRLRQREQDKKNESPRQHGFYLLRIHRMIQNRGYTRVLNCQGRRVCIEKESCDHEEMPPLGRATGVRG